MILSDL